MIGRSVPWPVKLEFPLEEDLELKAEDDDEEQEEDYGDNDAVSDICIVKVESAMEVAQRQKKQQQAGASWSNDASPQQSRNKETSPQQGWGKESPPPPGWNKDASGDQEEPQVNSTVTEAVGSPPELTPEKPPQGVVKACYSLSEDAEGKGLLIIPGDGYLEETSEAAAVAYECQSSDSGVGLVLAGLSGRPFSTFPMVGRGSGSGTPWGGNSASRTIRCTKCEEVFQGVEKLVFHMRAYHFIFMCPRCGKQFNHSSNLNRHMNVHRGVKSHSCNICGKCFTQKSTLHDHMNLHSGERPYRCSYCDVRFAHKPAIRRHLKEQHGKTTAENVMEASVAEIKVLIR